MPRTKSPEVRITVANFDRRYGQPEIYRVKREGVSPAEWTPFSSSDYIPNGSTPLLDAVARFFADLEAQRAKNKVIVGLLNDESGSMASNQKSVIEGVNEYVGSISGVNKVDPESAGKVIAVIMTDGLENDSHEVTKDQIRDLIAAKEEDGWTIIYMGANQDAWGEASGYGLSATASGSSVNYTASPKGTKTALAFAGVSTASYLTSNSNYATTLDSSLANSTLTEDGTWLDSTGAVSKLTDTLTGAAV